MHLSSNRRILSEAVPYIYVIFRLPIYKWFIDSTAGDEGAITEFYDLIG